MTERRSWCDGITRDDNQVPTSCSIPSCISNDARDAIELMDEAGLPLMPWQEFLLDAWMGVNADGRWAAPTVANETPRQNGKTRVIHGRMIAEPLFYNGSVIYTSQLQKTSTETFREMVQLVESKALKKFIAPKGIKTALGREEIQFKNGCTIKFLARTRTGGNGQHGSLLVFDEAQFLDPDAQSSFKPAISATLAARGPQTIYNGTPPQPGDYGLIFERLRNDALDGKSPRTCYTEWSAGYGGMMPATSVKRLWERCNPSYGVLIQPDTIEGEQAEMDADKFCHQRLGWWSGRAEAKTLIPAELWDGCAKADPDPWEKIAYGVKFTADGACVALSVCTVGYDGVAYVDFIKSELTMNGIQWLVRWLAERADECCGIGIDGYAGSTDLALQLVSEGVPRNAVMVARTRDACDANSMLMNALNDGTLRHGTDPALRESAIGSTRRQIGAAGGFGFGGDISERIESAALALWAARTSKRDPNGEAVVW